MTTNPAPLGKIHPTVGYRVGVPAICLQYCGLGGSYVGGGRFLEAGQQRRVFSPDGTITDTEYDGLGRTLLVTENAADAYDLDGVRRTAHRYDQYGRLELMAAVMPMHKEGDVNKWADVDWDAADGTLQITRFDYGADVLDKAGNKISEHNGWNKGSSLPQPRHRPAKRDREPHLPVLQRRQRGFA
jgi:YD repeat-containing protein